MCSSTSPDFTLKVMHNGAQVWTTRIVIGKPSMADAAAERDDEIHHHQSDLDTCRRRSCTTNICRRWRRIPTVLERMGLRVSYSGGGVHITQPPGDGNALGRIRFNFPNRFLVYQHDTPDKYMFGARRARLQPRLHARAGPGRNTPRCCSTSRARTSTGRRRGSRSMFGSAEQDIQLQPAPIWVHLTYQTAFVDDAGKLQMRRDVYDLDSRTLAAIKSERGVIEPAPERKREEIASRSTRRSAAARSASDKPALRQPWGRAPPTLSAMPGQATPRRATAGGRRRASTADLFLADLLPQQSGRWTLGTPEVHFGFVAAPKSCVGRVQRGSQTLTWLRIGACKPFGTLLL